jgi:hypothetical protein
MSVVSPTVPAVVNDGAVRGWRWLRVGDPMAPGEMLGKPPMGELRDAGVTVTAYEADLPRLSRCPVCGWGAVRWLATMTLPDDVHLPLGRGCTPDRAITEAPTSWSDVAQRLARAEERP